MNSEDRARLAAKLLMGEVYDFLQGPKTCVTGQPMDRMFDDMLKEANGDFTLIVPTIILTAEMMQITTTGSTRLIYIALMTAMTLNSSSEHTNAAFTDYLKDCRKFWQENKNNQSLIDEISDFSDLH